MFFGLAGYPLLVLVFYMVFGIGILHGVWYWYFTRYCYDQLMKLGWKCFLPLALVLFILSVVILKDSIGFLINKYLVCLYLFPSVLYIIYNVKQVGSDDVDVVLFTTLTCVNVLLLFLYTYY